MHRADRQRPVCRQLWGMAVACMCASFAVLQLTWSSAFCLSSCSRLRATSRTSTYNYLLSLITPSNWPSACCVPLQPSARDFKDIYVVFELMETDLHQVGTQ